MRYTSNDGSMQFHFWITRGGWSLVAMGRDPLYHPTGGFTLRDRLAEAMESEGSDYKRPVFEIDSVGYDLISVFATEYCGADATTFISAWVKEIDKELALGLTSTMETIEWKPYLNGMQEIRSYRPVFEKKVS